MYASAGPVWKIAWFAWKPVIEPAAMVVVPFAKFLSPFLLHLMSVEERQREGHGRCIPSIAGRLPIL
jgi:hypothetical protein